MVKSKKTLLKSLKNQNLVRAILTLGSFFVTFILGIVVIYGVFNEKISADQKAYLEVVKYIFAYFAGQTNILVGYYIANKGN